MTEISAILYRLLFFRMFAVAQHLSIAADSSVWCAFSYLLLYKSQLQLTYPAVLPAVCHRRHSFTSQAWIQQTHCGALRIKTFKIG